MAKNYDDHPWVVLYRSEASPNAAYFQHVRRYMEWLTGRGLALETSTRQAALPYIRELSRRLDRAAWKQGAAILFRFYDFLEGRGLVLPPAKELLTPAPGLQELVEEWISSVELKDSEAARQWGADYLHHLADSAIPIASSTWDTVGAHYKLSGHRDIRRRRALFSLQEYMVWNGYVLEVRMITSRPRHTENPIIEALILAEGTVAHKRTAYRRYADWLARTDRSLKGSTLVDVAQYVAEIRAFGHGNAEIEGALKELYRLLAARGHAKTAAPVDPIKAEIERAPARWRKLLTGWFEEDLASIQRRIAKRHLRPTTEFLRWLDRKRLALPKVVQEDLATFTAEVAVPKKALAGVNKFLRYLTTRGLFPSTIRFDATVPKVRRAASDFEVDSEEVDDLVRRALDAALSKTRSSTRLRNIRAALVARITMETGVTPGTVAKWSDLFFELSERRIVVPAKAGKSVFRISDRLVHDIEAWIEAANAAGHPLEPFMFQRVKLWNHHIQADADSLLEDMRKLMASVRSDDAEPFKVALLMSAYRQRGSAGQP